ncbi:hypothetical protein C2845_PM09G01090 [Panicum miliaceum]|uniref:FLZ-type domain-containing protein n=1 Tax=Panicum miliaceum TaxID=4540 RepID=A0A3L6RZP2_PANMI|nr:hypothetical protein C2845_PM09G01090 [Panicum miliaceum]
MPALLACYWHSVDQNDGGEVREGGDGCGGGHHFLDACFLSKRDIYVGGPGLPGIFGQSIDRPVRLTSCCRGDAAFCSDECRQDQRAMDV